MGVDRGPYPPEVPPTIAALLTARLDRLGRSERTVIERGAVIGQVFYRGAVEALVPPPVQPEVRPCAQGPFGEGADRPHEESLIGQETFKFLHALIRDAAYGALLKRTRAELHVGFVDWVESAARAIASSSTRRSAGTTSNRRIRSAPSWACPTSMSRRSGGAPRRT